MFCFCPPHPCVEHDCCKMWMNFETRLKKNCLTRWKMREEKEKKRDLAFSETPLIYEPHVRWRSNISWKLEQVKSSAFKLDQIFLNRSQAPEKNGSKDTNTLLFSLHPTLSISSDLLWAHLFLELDSTSEYYQLLVSKQELHVSHFWQESFLWQISGRRRQNKLDFMWNTSHHFSAILKKKKETTSLSSLLNRLLCSTAGQQDCPA